MRKTDSSFESQVTAGLYLHRVSLRLHTEAVAFVIRTFRPADFDRLWKIDQTCFAPGIAYTQMDLTGFITRRKAITLVAEYPRGSEFTGAIAGFAVAQPIRNIGRILTLDILPEARRFGLGTRLMQECENRLRAGGCQKIYLETAVNNEPALRLYEKLGYGIQRKLPLYYPPHGLDAYLLGKDL
jgi:[ribosomal protein S18]-alanine N-acetyltransferase